VHRGQRGQCYVYELLHDAPADAGGPHLAGLIDVAALKAGTTTESSRGENIRFAPPSRGQRAPDAGDSRTGEQPATPDAARVSDVLPIDEAEPRMVGGALPRRSYPHSLAAVAR